MALPCLTDILNAIIDGQKEGGPHGTLDFFYIVTGFYLKRFDLTAIESELDALDSEVPHLEGAKGHYHSVPVFPSEYAPKDSDRVSECHNVVFSFERMAFLD